MRARHDRTGTGDLEGYTIDYRGIVRVMMPTQPVRVLVRVQGYQVAELFGVREDTRVTLQRALTVELLWPPGDALTVPADRQLHVQLVHERVVDRICDAVRKAAA